MTVIISPESHSEYNNIYSEYNNVDCFVGKFTYLGVPGDDSKLLMILKEIMKQGIHQLLNVLHCLQIRTQYKSYY